MGKRRPNLSIIDCGEDKILLHQSLCNTLRLNHVDSNHPAPYNVSRDKREQITKHVLPVGRNGTGYSQYIKQEVIPYDGYIFLGFPRSERDTKGKEFFESYVLYNLFHATSLLVGGRITQTPEYMVRLTGQKIISKPVYFFGPDYEHLHRILENFKSPGVRAIPAVEMAHFSKQIGTIQDDVLHQFSKCTVQAHDSLHLTPSKRARTLARSDVPRPKFVVGILCSAFTKHEPFLKLTEELAATIVHHKWGLMSGGCSQGMMGAAHRTVKKENGYSAAVTLMDFGLQETRYTPDDIDKEWQKLIISERIREIGNQSDAIVAMPGGFMSFQELLQFIILKRAENVSMQDKPIIVYNKDGFYDYFTEVAKKYGFDRYFKEAKTIDECEKLLVAAEKKQDTRTRYQRPAIDWERY